MKKFMLLVALFLGIPSFAAADTLGCVGGGAVGAGLGSLVGRGNGTLAAQVVLGLMGCSAGSRMEDGTYGRDRDVETVVVHQEAYPSQYNGGVRQKCYDQGSGGYADCDELARRYRYNNASYSRPYVPTFQHTVYARTQPVARQPVVEKSEPKPVVNNYGPTVDNYWNSQMIHPSCKVLNEKTKLPLNHGADGKCLLRMASVLADEQTACECVASGKEACEVNLAKVACPKQYNPGVWAAVYNRLGKELVELQKKEQGADIVIVAR